MAREPPSSSVARLYKSFGVLFSGFIIVFLQSGSFKAFGVLYEDVVKKYDTSNLFAAWVFSFELAASFVLAGLSGAVLSKISNRAMGVIGGILFGLGFVLQGLIGQTVAHLFLFTGLTAVGVGLLFFAVYMSYVEHFGDSFSLAYSLRDVFAFVGVTTMPPVLEFVRRSYDLHGAFIILGAITWNGVVAGVLMKPHLKSEVTVTPGKPENHKSSQISNQGSCKYKNARLCFSALKNHPIAIVSFLVHSLSNFNFVIWALFLVPYGTSLGYSSDMAVFFSTSGGIGGFLGKVAVIIVFYYQKMNQLISNAVPGVIYVIAVAGYILCDNYVVLLTCSFLSGFALAFADASTCAMTPRYFCEQHLRQGVVIAYFSGGISIQIGGIAAGAILDVTSSFTVLFAVMFSLTIVIILLAVLMEKMDGVTKDCAVPDKESECEALSAYRVQ